MSDELKTRILSKTTDRDIFIHYMNLMGYPGYTPPRTVRSPFRKDRNPSFGVYRMNNGTTKYYFKDFAGDHGDCFKFVQLYYEIYCGKKLSFYETMINISSEMNLNVTKGLGTKNVYRPKPIVILPEVRKVFDGMKEFSMLLERNIKGTYPTEAQSQYFEKYGVKLTTADKDIDLMDCTVRIIEKGSGKLISTKEFINTPTNPVFNFTAESFADESKAFRVYQPLVDKKDHKHYGNVKSDHIYSPEKSVELTKKLHAQYGYDERYNKILVLLGGYKDAFLFNRLTPFYCCATGGESWALHESFVSWIKKCGFKPILLYDDDTPGRKSADNICFKLNIPNITIYDFAGTIDGKDFSDYVEYAQSRGYPLQNQKIHKAIFDMVDNWNYSSF